MTFPSIRRAIALLATGAAITVAAHGADLTALVTSATPTFTQTVLQTIPFPGHGYYTKLVRTEIPPGVAAPRHVHPGLEATYVVKGSVTMIVEGQPDRVLNAGDSFAVPANTPHLFKNGTAASELITTYVLEVDQPPMRKVP